MGKRTKKAQPAGPQIGVTVCQACWAGDNREVVGRVPLCGLGQRADVQARGIDCFDVCEGDSVTVIRPSPEGRRAGGRPCWLRDTHDPEVRAAVSTWLDEGGPGLAEPPRVLDFYTFTPSRRVRNQHED